MIYISHRGNLNGPNPEKENTWEYIQRAISFGYEVEIDVWKLDDDFYLGHDEPKEKIELKQLEDNYLRLWIHCKNRPAFEYFFQRQKNTNWTRTWPPLHYFWHTKEEFVLTSMDYIWMHCDQTPLHNSIVVLPENQKLNQSDFLSCNGICSDYIQEYKYGK